MRYSKHKLHSFMVVKLESEFSAGTAGNELLMSLLEEVRGGDSKILMDFDRVTYINSSGIRLLLQMHQAVQSNGGLFVLVNLPAMISKVLDDLRLSDFFRKFGSLEEAVREVG